MITIHNFYKIFSSIILAIIGLSFHFFSVNDVEVIASSNSINEYKSLSCETNKASKVLIQQEFNTDKILLKLIIKRKNEIVAEKDIEIYENTFGYGSLPEIELECSSGGFNINYIFRFGNEYILFNHFIKEGDSNNFYLKNIVFYGSNRNSITIEGSTDLDKTFINNYNLNTLALSKLEQVYFQDNLQKTDELSLKRLVDNLDKQCNFDLLGNKKMLAIVSNEVAISENNLESYNILEKKLKDKEFYLESIFLSGIVLRTYQNSQSYLNLADSYWELNKIDLAKKAYQKYIQLMSENDKEDKIPKRVSSRLNN
ncbi:hypothetical protein [Aquimarina sp. SS2-1]|uniref:hypothetical protein n=1 Tax=Aquimarina besae TaxID=3342247 RepID=UPI00366D2E5A